MVEITATKKEWKTETKIGNTNYNFFSGQRDFELGQSTESVSVAPHSRIAPLSIIG